MPNSFWTGGPAAHAKGLKQQYQAQLQILKQRLAECEDQKTQEQIKTEIRNLDQQYRQKQNSSNNNFH